MSRKKKTQIKPASEVVVCKPADNKTESGLQLATDEKAEKPEVGIVVAIGDHKPRPADIKVGDRVVFRRYSSNHTMVEGKPYNFIDFKDIMAKVV